MLSLDNAFADDDITGLASIGFAASWVWP